MSVRPSRSRPCRAARAILLACVGGMGLTGGAVAGCIDDTAALRAVLALPAAAKSGRTFCLDPGRYDPAPSDFEDAFVGIDPARPVTFTAADPADPPVLTRWVMSVSPARAAQGAVSGDMILRGVVIVLDDVPEAPRDRRGFSGHRHGVVMGVGAPTRNVLIDAVTVRGSLGEARLGAPELERNLTAIRGDRLRNVTIRDSRFERVVNGIIVTGTDITITGNRMRHSWGDMVRIAPQVVPGSGCADTARVTVRANAVHDNWANNRLHPDVVQMFATHRAACDIRDVLIEGNLAWPGAALRQPGHPTGLAPRPARPAPPQLAETGVLHAVTGPGRSVLPQAECTDRRDTLGVRLDGASAGPVTVVPPPGTGLRIGRRPASELTLTDAWETWRLTCLPRAPNSWTALPSPPSMQGIFTSPLPETAGYRDITIRHNIFWTTAASAINFRDEDNRNITVQGNTFLQPWPGDLNGDGRHNDEGDGIGTRFPLARMILEGGEGHAITGNIAHGPAPNGAESDPRDNLFLPGRGTAQVIDRLFAAAPGPVLSPGSAAEAVALARPRPGTIRTGIGAAAATPSGDPVDWSWASDPW